MIASNVGSPTTAAAVSPTQPAAGSLVNFGIVTSFVSIGKVWAPAGTSFQEVEG